MDYPLILISREQKTNTHEERMKTSVTSNVMFRFLELGRTHSIMCMVFEKCPWDVQVDWCWLKGILVGC